MRRSEELLAVFAGGCVGALARTALVRAFPVHPGAWPWPTFAVNIAGAALLGLLVARPPRSWRRPLLMSGVCGTLTTFSTMMLELLQLLEVDAPLAAAYLLASVGGGLAVVVLARKVRPA